MLIGSGRNYVNTALAQIKTHAGEREMHSIYILCAHNKFMDGNVGDGENGILSLPLYMAISHYIR
jgi:hypothetical protein